MSLDDTITSILKDKNHKLESFLKDKYKSWNVLVEKDFNFEVEEGSDGWNYKASWSYELIDQQDLLINDTKKDEN